MVLTFVFNNIPMHLPHFLPPPATTVEPRLSGHLWSWQISRRRDKRNSPDTWNASFSRLYLAPVEMPEGQVLTKSSCQGKELSSFNVYHGPFNSATTFLCTYYSASSSSCNCLCRYYCHHSGARNVKISLIRAQPQCSPWLLWFISCYVPC